MGFLARERNTIVRTNVPVLHVRKRMRTLRSVPFSGTTWRIEYEHRGCESNEVAKVRQKQDGAITNNNTNNNDNGQHNLKRKTKRLEKVRLVLNHYEWRKRQGARVRQS